MLTGVFSASLSAQAKTNAEAALADIQTTSGFIPGQRAAVTGNCYGFVSAVCERLFGVGYNGEGLYGNYLSKHSSGNFYTVATYKNSATKMDKAIATEIKNFFVNNAMPGDIVHYGVPTSGTANSATHTFMIQSVDESKLRIYHANYQTSDYSRDTCHIDDIIWSSFLESPTQTEYNDKGNMVSLNAIFYNKMKSGGLGISINRYTKYADLYNIVGPTIPTLSVENSMSDAISLSWSAVTGATKYEVRYKKATDEKYTTFSNKVTDTDCVISGLKVGTEYKFKVRAYVGEWKDFSSVKTITALPPAITDFELSCSSTGIKLSWSPSSDATGYYVYRCDTYGGEYERLRILTNPVSTGCTDKTIEYGKKYYYRVEAYKKVNKSYYKNSSPIKVKMYYMQLPIVTISRMSTNSLRFAFASDDITDKYEYVITNGEGTVVKQGETTDFCIAYNLTIGGTYTCRVSGVNALGRTSTVTASKQALPPTPNSVSAAASNKGVVVSYPVRSDVDGYYIYRSESSSSGFKKIGTVSDETASSFTDSSVTYGKAYYYKVKRYVVSGDKEYSGALSAPTAAAVKIAIAKVKGVTAKSTSNTVIALSWSPAELAGEYEVVYREKGDKAYKSAGVTKKTSFSVKGLRLGKEYELKVRGRNVIGAGAYSAVVSKKALPPDMDAPVLKAASDGIKVSWKTYSKASGYRIYRKASGSSSYELYKTVSSAKTSSFKDKSVRKGKTYSYKVQCFKKSGVKTYYSAKSKASGIKF